jgi:hypothetical protein
MKIYLFNAMNKLQGKIMEPDRLHKCIFYYDFKHFSF